MKLEQVIKEICKLDVFGSTDRDVLGIAIDSRRVRTGYLFAALKGTRLDGHDFIQRAVEMGATTVLCSKLPNYESKL